MTDLGQTFYEEKRHRFNRFNVFHIVINPQLQGYPPAFMICREMRGTKPYEYAIGVSLVQLNDLLMKRATNADRLAVSELLADALMKGCQTQTLRVQKTLGHPLTLVGPDVDTTLCRFVAEPDEAEKPLYFFRLGNG